MGYYQNEKIEKLEAQLKQADEMLLNQAKTIKELQAHKGAYPAHNDDELIEAMARAIFAVVIKEAEFVPPKDDWKMCIDDAKAALAVCRPVIEERLWKRFEEMAEEKNERIHLLEAALRNIYEEARCADVWGISAALKETGE